jgi:DNA repair exonuclease SbcCD ATPase subunit
MTTLATIRTRIDRALAGHDAARTAVHAETAELALAGAVARDTAAAQAIIQQVARTCQQRAHRQIAAIVTRCLQAVFDDAYTFRIIFDRKPSGKTEPHLAFVRDGVEYEPLDAAGGGVIDVAAFALRLAALLLSVPRRRLLLCLDEPFRHLSKNHLPRVRGLLETLAAELKVQFIIVTHAEELQAGKVIEL